MRTLIFVLLISFFAGTFSSAAEKRTGPVRASGRALADDQGEFHALGATMMWALWAYKHDRAWLDRNLQFLSENGFHYIRALGVIDRRIETDPRAYWYRLHMAMEWPDYDAMIAGLTEHVYNNFGMRIEWTIFGGACDFNDSQKRELLDKFIRMSHGREHMILHFEVANEYHGTCWRGDEGTQNLRMHTRYLNDRTDILVAASSPYGEQGVEMTKLYSGGIADIGTQHFDRDVWKGDGYWRPARQSWEYPYNPGVPAIGSNNEPIGPGSSVASDTDPWTNVANAVVSYISGLALHVYHGEFGVRADDGDYTQFYTEVTQSFKRVSRYVPADITNWTRENHHWAGHPFSSEGEIGYPPARGSGAVRHYGAHSGNDFFTFPMGIEDYLRVRAKHNMKFCVVHPLTGQLLDRVSLNAGQSYDVRGLPAAVLRGKWDSADDGCEDYSYDPPVSKIISLQTWDETHYLCAEGGGGREVVANRTAPGPWEQWTFADVNGGALESGDQIHLAAHNGLFMVAELGGGSVLNANRPVAGVWETFTIIKVSGSGRINSGDQIALRSINGFYVVAELGGGAGVNADRTGRGPWETFRLRFE